MSDPARRMSLVQMRSHPWLKEAYESSTVGTDVNSNSACGSSIEQVPTTSVVTYPSAVASQCPTVLANTDLTNRNNLATILSETPAATASMVDKEEEKKN